MTTRAGGPPSPAVLDGLARLARAAVERRLARRAGQPACPASPSRCAAAAPCSGRSR